MPSALLLNGLLEDSFALASLNHVIHLLLCRPLSGHNQRAPLHHFPALQNAELLRHTMLTQCWQMSIVQQSEGSLTTYGETSSQY